MPQVRINFTAFLSIFLLAGHWVFGQKFYQQTQIVISDNVIYIKMQVNDRGPYNFMFDSGASTIGQIDRRMAKELGLKVVGFEERSDGVSVKREFLVSVDKMSLGQVSFSNLKLTVKDCNTESRQIHIDGVVGRDFFYNYLLTIDGPSRLITVTKDELNIYSKGVVSYTKPFLIPGKIGAKDVHLNLDTGSTGSFVFPKSTLTGVHYVDTDGQLNMSKLNTAYVLQEAILNDDLIVGETKEKGRKIYYTNKAHQASVGEDFLKEHVISIDQRRKLIRIE